MSFNHRIRQVLFVLFSQIWWILFLLIVKDSGEVYTFYYKIHIAHRNVQCLVLNFIWWCLLLFFFLIVGNDFFHYINLSTLRIILVHNILCWIIFFLKLQSYLLLFLSFLSIFQKFIKHSHFLTTFKSKSSQILQILWLFY